MALHQPVVVQPAGGDPSLVTTGQEFRNYTRALLGGDDISGSQGVLATGHMQVTQHGSGALSVDIASGQAFVVGDDITGQGTYHVWNDAAVTVTGITVPATGTYHHRIVLQIQDKFANGAWTGYAAACTALLDTGSGLPAEPNSAITLATIDVPSGSPSVTNSMINDYRIVIGRISAVKTADTGRANTVSLADDPDLQLLNLASARYWVSGVIFYNGGSGASEGDFQYTFRVSSGADGVYSSAAINSSGSGPTVGSNNWTDGRTAQTQGTSSGLSVAFQGQYHAPNRPCYLVLQWAQGTSKGTNTTVQAGSYMTAKRLT